MYTYDAEEHGQELICAIGRSLMEPHGWSRETIAILMTSLHPSASAKHSITSCSVRGGENDTGLVVKKLLWRL